MANKLVISFTFVFKGDGLSNSVTITFATSPVVYGGSSERTGILTNVTTALPTDISDVTSPSIAVSGASIGLLNLTATITFGSVPANGQYYSVSGNLEF